MLLKVILLCTVIPITILIKYILDSRALRIFIENFENIDASNGRLFVHALPNAWPLGSPPFFVEPYGFLLSWARTLKLACTDCFTGQKRATKLWFKFRIQEQCVLVPFGSAARRLLLTNRKFNSTMGYALMTSTIKNIIPLPKFQSDAAKDDPNSLPSTPFAWLFRKVVRPDVMEKYPSMILKDVERELCSWQEQGVLDPFDKLRRLLIIAVLRITIGSEILSDPLRVKQTISGLIAIEEANGLPDFPTRPLSIWSVIFVLLLNPLGAISTIHKKVNRFLGGIRLYKLFVKAVEERHLATQDFQQDILQTLLEEDREGGIDNGAIAQRVIMALFTAGGSSSSVYPWFHIFLCEHPDWKLQVEKEIEEFLEKHVPLSNENSFKRSSNCTLDSLSQLDLSTWEDSLPVLEKCLRETLRLVLINAVPRMNMGEPFNLSPSTTTSHADWTDLSNRSYMAEKWFGNTGNHTTIESGGFVLYLTSDVHLDETMYPDPLKFNPARNYPDEPTDFLGWGAGLHVCTGQRLAKIMIKVVTVLLMNQFEFGLADRIPSGDERSIPQSRLFGIGKPQKGVRMKYRSKYRDA